MDAYRPLDVRRCGLLAGSGVKDLWRACEGKDEVPGRLRPASGSRRWSMLGGRDAGDRPRQLGERRGRHTSSSAIATRTAGQRSGLE